MCQLNVKARQRPDEKRTGEAQGKIGLFNYMKKYLNRFDKRVGYGLEPTGCSGGKIAMKAISAGGYFNEWNDKFPQMLLK